MRVRALLYKSRATMANRGSWQRCSHRVPFAASALGRATRLRHVELMAGMICPRAQLPEPWRSNRCRSVLLPSALVFYEDERRSSATRACYAMYQATRLLRLLGGGDMCRRLAGAAGNCGRGLFAPTEGREFKRLRDRRGVRAGRTVAATVLSRRPTGSRPSAWWITAGEPLSRKFVLCPLAPWSVCAKPNLTKIVPDGLCVQARGNIIRNSTQLESKSPRRRLQSFAPHALVKHSHS